MDAYAQVLLIAIPGFVLLMIIEGLAGWAMGKKTFRSLDTISSLSSGSTNTLKSVMKLTVVIISYSWLVDKIALLDIKTTWVVWVLSFIAIDFASYWSHRLSHAINVFWNRHIIHHSSEEFNLACALRQPISNLFSLSFIFLFPAALLGLPAKVIAVIAPIHLFMQFWYHTTLIPKLGWLEYILVTPSQHRVHHAINDIYLDKNLAAIFCVWDRLFGTFQEELECEPCVYGVKRQVNTWNPIKINFQHIWTLIQDAWLTNNWKDKFRIWFMPTGWRPADVAAKYPIEYTIDPKTQEKYDPQSSLPLHIWSWIQYALSTGFMIHLLLIIADITFIEMLLYGSFLFMMIFSYSTLMDRDNHSIFFELFKSLFGISILYMTGDWFGLSNIHPILSYVVAGYLVISVIVVTGFVKYEISSSSSLTDGMNLN